MKINRAFLAGAVVSAVVALGANALASTIATLETQANNSAATLGDVSTPVISAILSAPSTVNGHTFTAYSFLVNDGTGSADIYGNLSGLGYTPTVGDALTLSGTYSPYHQIPEIGTVTAISLQSSGNSVPGPTTTTISAALVNGTAGPLPLNLAGYLVKIYNVSLYTDSGATIPVSGNFGTGNTTLYMKDSGGNIMEVYDWVTSYSSDAAMIGSQIPEGTVDVVGFLSQSAGFAPEITPMLIEVPEPSMLALAGLGLAGLLIRRRIS